MILLCEHDCIGQYISYIPGKYCGVMLLNLRVETSSCIVYTRDLGDEQGQTDAQRGDKGVLGFLNRKNEYLQTEGWKG